MKAKSKAIGTCRWITEQEVSELLAMSLQKLRNDRCQGRGLPYYKLGRSVRYKFSDVLGEMEQCRVVPANSSQEGAGLTLER